MGAEIFVGDKHGEFGMDEWSKLIGRFPKYADRAIGSVISSEGSRIQKILKTVIQTGGPANQPYPRLSPHSWPIFKAKQMYRRKMDRAARGVKVRKTRQEKAVAGAPGHNLKMEDPRFPMQKLAGAIRYEYDGSIKTATVGPLKDWKYIYKKIAEGFTMPVTPRMRRFLFAAGMPLAKSTTELKVPPRPVVAPVFRAEHDRIIRNVQEKSIRNIYRYLTAKTKEQVEEAWPI